MSGLRLTESTTQKTTVKILPQMKPEVVEMSLDKSTDPEPDEILGTPVADPFGTLDIDNHVIGLLVDNGIPDETALRLAVSEGRDLTKIKGIGKVTQQEILDALVETDA